MRADAVHETVAESGAQVASIPLSLGALDLVRFVDYRHAFPRHAHEQFTIGVFEKHNGRLGFRGSKWAAADDTILAVPPDEVHSAEPTPGFGWTYRAIYPSPALVAQALGARSRREATVFFPQPVIHDPALAMQLSTIIRLFEGGAVDMRSETMLLCALNDLVQHHGSAPPRPSRSLPPTARAVETAREYLRTHFSQPVRLGNLAAICDTSPFHLVRSFTRIVGMPPHAYQTQVRANRARDMLVQGESPAGVALRCGFCDQSHLTRTFKKLFGVTPGAYTSACVSAGNGVPRR